MKLAVDKVIRFLNGVNVFCAVMIPFVIAFSSAAVNVFLVMALVTFLIKKALQRQNPVLRTAVTWPYLALFAVSLMSFHNTINLTSSLLGLWKLFKHFFLMFVIIDVCRNRKVFRAVVVSLLFGMFIASFDGLWQIAFGKDLFRGFDYLTSIGLRRVRASFPTANVFANYLNLLVPLAVSLAFYVFKGRRRVFMLAVAAIGAVCLVLTFSRGAGIGFLAAVIMIAVVKRDKVLAGLMLAVLAISFVYMPAEIKDWAGKEKNVWTIIFNGDRLNIFRTSLEMIKAHPIIGVGVNTYSINYPVYKIKETEYFTGYSVYSHNHFLQTACEVGLLGAAALFWLLFELFRKWKKVYVDIKDNFYSAVSLGLSASLLAFLINGMTETALYYSKVAVLFWFNTGLLLSSLRVPNAET